MQQQVSGAEDLLETNIFEVAHHRQSFCAGERFCARALQMVVHTLPN